MNTYEVIQNRRSIRNFAARPVEKEKIEKLLRAGMQAPSAANQQPWEFIVVQDQATLKKLSETHIYATPIADAPLGIVVLSNEKDLIFPVYWQQDLAAATENILLEAVELGLGAVWLGIAPEEDRMEYLKQFFNLPEGVQAFALLALGYSDENTFEDRFDPSRVHYEKYL